MAASSCPLPAFQPGAGGWELEALYKIVWDDRRLARADIRRDSGRRTPGTRNQLRPQGRRGFPVVIGEGSHPFPFRTRKLSPLPPMVLRGVTAWESRSLPGLFLKPASKRRAFFLYGSPDAAQIRLDNTARMCRDFLSAQIYLPRFPTPQLRGSAAGACTQRRDDSSTATTSSASNASLLKDRRLSPPARTSCGWSSSTTVVDWPRAAT